MSTAVPHLGKTKLECISPILSVRGLATSIEYYEVALGFKRAAWVTEGATFALVVRDGVGIYLCQGGQGNPGTWVWIGVDDVEVLHEEFQAGGARILHGPTNYPWAMEIRVEDPDGHVIRFGSEPMTDRPFEEFK